MIFNVTCNLTAVQIYIGIARPEFFYEYLILL